MFGIISQQAMNDGWGTAFYVDKDGVEYECVGSTTDSSANNWTWADKRVVPVKSWVRDGRPHETRDGELPKMPPKGR